MNTYKTELFVPTDILVPKQEYLPSWSVIACDQYTSDENYWQQVERIVGSSPSSLRMIFPEVYLDKDDTHVVQNANEHMRKYLESDIFENHKNTYIYVKRYLPNGGLRKGLIGAADLMNYDFSAESKSLIRPTEDTVYERIPPRVKMRDKAILEIPHALLLIDDFEDVLFSRIEAGLSAYKKLYDFELMLGGGRIQGYLMDDDTNAFIASFFKSKSKSEFAIAVGDGNHSLAAARVCFDNWTKNIGPETAFTHPSRYAMAELLNIHDASLLFEPIHRVIFNTNPISLLEAINAMGGSDFSVKYITANGQGEVHLPSNGEVLACGALQIFLDHYLLHNDRNATIDYIHGESETIAFGKMNNNVAFLLPALEKSSFFQTITSRGTLPRKAFSIGNASDKRYYLEARKIV